MVMNSVLGLIELINVNLPDLQYPSIEELQHLPYDLHVQSNSPLYKYVIHKSPIALQYQ